MKRSFQPGISAVVLTAAMLQAFVPASAETIYHTGTGIHNYSPLTAVSDSVYALGTTTVNVLTGGSIGTDLGAVNNNTMTIFGTLVDGTAINNPVYIYQSAKVMLATTAVPEPSSFVLLTFLLFCFTQCRVVRRVFYIMPGQACLNQCQVD